MPLLQYFGATNSIKARPNDEGTLIVGTCRGSIEVKEGDPRHPLSTSPATTVVSRLQTEERDRND